LTPGTNMPSKTGFASPGTFQQGTGIAVGEPAPSGRASCYCIRAPCNCPGSSQGGPLPFPNQPLNTVPASAGTGNVAFGNAAGTGAGTR
jgi:hypothetical protein